MFPGEMPPDITGSPAIPPPDPQYIQQMMGDSFPPSGPGSAFPPQSPGPLFLDVDPPPPDQAFIDAVWDYIPKQLSASRAFVKDYEEKWEKWLKLWKDDIDLQEWKNWPCEQNVKEENSRIDTTQDTFSEDDVWESNYVHAPGYMVDQYADRAYPQIFDGPEFFTVMSEDATEIPEEDTFPVHRKFQQYMLRMLLQGKIHARMYEILTIWPMIGTVFTKTFWYEHVVPRWQQSQDTGKIYETDEIVYECPISQVIFPDRILPDPKATNNDIQRWRFIGHRVDMTYDEIIEGFEAGIFDLNRDEIEKQWEARGGSAEGDDEQPSIFSPEEPSSEPKDDTTFVELWEWHGRVPYKGRLRESWGVIAVRQGADDADDGIQIKCRQAPLLRAGVRPYSCAHFYQYPGPLGLGMFDRNESILYTVSQLIAQIEDNVRLTANCGWQGGPNSMRQLRESGNKIRPGMLVDIPIGEEKLQALQMPEFDAANIQNLITMLLDLLQKRTTITDTWQGMGKDSQTATGAQIQQQQGQTPSRTKTDLFTRDCLEPLLNLSAAFIQQLSFDDHTIAVTGADGQPQQVTITEDEIKKGKFKVVATLTRQDSQSIAKAQSIERIIQPLLGIEQRLMQEGVQISFAEVIRRYVDLLGVDGADRIVKIMSSRDQAQQQMVQQLVAKLEELQAQIPPQKGNGSAGPPLPPNPELPPGANGGPYGPVPSDANQQALDLQMANQDNLPEVY